MACLKLRFTHPNEIERDMLIEEFCPVNHLLRSFAVVKHLAHWAHYCPFV